VRFSVFDIYLKLYLEGSAAADAHAHILEYGFKMQLQLDGSASIDGELRSCK
jgi:hypothetical protein